MISTEQVAAIEESVTGAELFANIIQAFSAYGFGDIGGSNIVIPTEITQAEYDALPTPDETNNIYLITDG